MPGLSLTILNDRNAVQMSINAPPEGADRMYAEPYANYIKRE